MKTLKTYKVKAFTLIEMLVVLLIISVLLLLFVPNLTKQKDSVKETGNAAVVKVVESQAELYELNHTNDQATLAKLIADGNITNKQAESYRAYYAKNSGETRAVADSGLHFGGDPSDLDDRQFYLSGLIGIDQDELSAGGRKSIFCRV